MSIYQQLIDKRERLDAKINKYQNLLQHFPEGRLHAHKNGNAYKYFHVLDKARTYIPQKDRELAINLAKKMYLQAATKDAQAEQKAIDYYLKHTDSSSAAQKLLAQNPGIASLLEDALLTDEERYQNWERSPYPAYTAFPEALIHPGPFGKMYRSKTEADIAFQLKQNRIPNRYEMMHELNGTSYPIDFTTIHPSTGKYIYWEHCGMMDRASYALKIGSKLLDFESAGIFPGVNLILTFESKKFPMNSNQIAEIIEQWYG